MFAPGTTKLPVTFPAKVPINIPEVIISPVALTCPRELTLPTVKILPPVILPVALTIPEDNKLPLPTLPV